VNAAELSEEAGTGVAPNPRIDRETGAGRELDATGGKPGMRGVDGVDCDRCSGCAG
jgi:hypothetical protein